MSTDCEDLPDGIPELVARLREAYLAVEDYILEVRPPKKRVVGNAVHNLVMIGRIIAVLQVKVGAPRVQEVAP